MSKTNLIPDPVSRTLRIFAFDPSLSAQFDTAGIGEISIEVPWERKLKPGPIGEYIEVVDVDPASDAAYKPVDLNDPRLLAQDGLAPSESNPQFHQQMTYAVAMTTIGHFEQALGRVALWSTRRTYDSIGKKYQNHFVRRLRIYPHALRDRNAFYSPEKKALLFGYFPVSIKDANNTPGTLVFTCLSHDIIAHETTHALLDGVHPRFNEPMNPDVLAFHEAFADIVALFQRFAYPGVLRDQIARTRGDLAGENLLGQLAQQFGRASGRGSALRDALGGINPATGKWEARVPNVRDLEKTREPHARGAILVAAVFGAFLKVYRARTVDLLRIASEGTGVLRAGDIHPDLANRLAEEAARCAKSILQMCVRAIDYCPPVGITFGDYLRAIVTADHDFNPEDPNRCRLAFVESFRQWGIYPEGMRSMSAEGLLWLAPNEEEMDEQSTQSQTALSRFFASLNKIFSPDPWDLETDRRRAWEGVGVNATSMWKWLTTGKGREMAAEIGIVLDATGAPPTVFRSKKAAKDANRLSVEVHSVRTARRRSPRGGVVTDLVVEITQRRRGYFDAEEQKKQDAPGAVADENHKSDFLYRAGCTLLINAATMKVRRIIRTPGTITDDRQLERMRRYLADEMEPGNAFARARDSLDAREPFALLHRHDEND